jgi:hypothetical protein
MVKECKELWIKDIMVNGNVPPTNYIMVKDIMINMELWVKDIMVKDIMVKDIMVDGTMVNEIELRVKDNILPQVEGTMIN